MLDFVYHSLLTLAHEAADGLCAGERSKPPGQQGTTNRLLGALIDSCFAWNF
jgi:hypothetical protein